MTKRIFRSICIVALAVFAASMVLIMGVLYRYFSEVSMEQLKIETDLAAEGVTNAGKTYLDHLEDTDYRITWIHQDGTVLYDSQTDAGQMENHLEREEIRQAAENGYGESSRYSATLMERYLYAAKRLEDDSILRLSVGQRTVLSLVLGMIQPIGLVFLVAFVLAVLLASRSSKSIIRPLNDLNLDHPLDNEEYEELSPLLRRIDRQQKELKRQEAMLQEKQDELDVVIGNMREGIIFLNARGKILSMNPAAMALLGADSCCVGRDILTVSRSLDLQEVLETARQGEHAEKTMALQGGYYQMDAAPVNSDGAVSGVALLLFDVTEKEKAEQMRREFTANVSHELKTPLHIISGYAELIKNGMVKEHDIIPFAEKIYTETGRMVRLVEDIIDLSHLDEGAGSMEYEWMDLYVAAETAVNRLTLEAASEGITLELSGETSVLHAIPQLLYGIVFNLCDNAVKYNQRGGIVSVEVKNEKEAVRLSVKDTGIGIPAEHQEHIFERFYRVDKSHSKEVGGTGLGLSIVKHAAKIHGGKITLHSTVGEGTEIMIRFPKSERS